MNKRLEYYRRESKGHYLVFELVGSRSGTNVNGTAAVGTALLLVLLLGETLATSHGQILPCALGVGVGHVVVGGVVVGQLAQQSKRGGASTLVLLLGGAVAGNGAGA
jgi:hypothetical protein